MQLKNTMDKFYFDLVINELKLMNKEKNKDKITHNSLLYLDLISYMEDCTVSKIAETLKVAKSAVTLKVKELEKAGLLKKEQSKKDKRIYYLKTTNESDKVYELYEKAFTAATYEIKDNYKREDIEQFCQMLKVFSKHFNEKTKNEVENE